jgi:hypothetical protein
MWTLTSVVIHRLFDRVTVIGALELGWSLQPLPGRNAGALIDLMGRALFGVILLAIPCFAGPVASRVLALFPNCFSQTAAVQRGFEILCTRRTSKVVPLISNLCLRSSRCGSSPRVGVMPTLPYLRSGHPKGRIWSLVLDWARSSAPL